MDNQKIIDRVRRRLDQVAIYEEDPQTDSEVFTSVSTSFSNEDLVSRIELAVQEIASVVKAQHVPQLIRSGATEAQVNENSIRILESRVFRDNNRAVKRSVDSHRRLEGRFVNNVGLEPSTEQPVYTYEDGEIRVYPTGGTLEIYYIHSPSITSIGDPIYLDERFQAAIVEHVSASCYQTLRQHNLAEFAFNTFDDEISPYHIAMRLKRSNDKEVDVE